MSEEDLELLITTDDPGEDTLEEDTFHQADKTIGRRSGHPQQDRDATRQN
jgi:hypothetical protein